MGTYNDVITERQIGMQVFCKLSEELWQAKDADDMGARDDKRNMPMEGAGGGGMGSTRREATQPVRIQEEEP